VRSSRSGFTLIEVLVAITILAVGVVAMAGSAAAVTRMIGRGKIDTRATQLATERLEILRRAAYFTTPKCTGAALANGGPQTTTNVTLAWTVAVSGSGRILTVNATYNTKLGPRTEVLTTYIEC
jgi:prepilin-type N-terminal cleavage/methylation domain-containing protein